MVYGEVLVILAQVVWAIALLLQKKVVGNVDPLTVTFVSSLAGSLYWHHSYLQKTFPSQELI